MLPAYKTKAVAALGRLEGLAKKVRAMIEQDEYCPSILQQVLAMQGHIKHVQEHVLESHLHTCAQKKLSSKEKDAFIRELVTVIGLSKR